MRTLRAFLMGVVTAGVVALATGVSAAPGSTQDPDDASYQIDIKTVFHNDDGSNVTYYMQSWSNFDDKDWICVLGWDFDENGTRDGVFVWSMTYGPSAYVAKVASDGGESQVGEGSLARAKVGSPHSASGSTTQNTLRATVSKSLMQKAGMGSGDSGYRYSIGCGEVDTDWESGQKGDSTKDWEKHPIVHSFGGTATPSAKPRPTAQPTAAPTAAPAVVTPQPTVAESTQTPSSTASDVPSPSATTVALGETEETSGSNVVPIVAGIAVLGGLVSAGALTLARRRAG